MIYHFESFTNIDKFNRNELMEVYTEESLFRVLLHLVFCKRSCDRVEDYCWKCSRAQDRNFQSQTLFDGVLLEERDNHSKLGIDDKQIDFDVFCLIIQQEVVYLMEIANGKKQFNMLVMSLSYLYQFS